MFLEACWENEENADNDLTNFDPESLRKLSFFEFCKVFEVYGDETEEKHNKHREAEKGEIRTRGRSNSPTMAILSDHQKAKQRGDNVN